MQTLHQNLFIVVKNPFVSNRLVTFLEQRFTNTLSISIFVDMESVYKNLNETTSIVVLLDFDLKKEEFHLITSEIKKINPKTEVILLSKNKDISLFIDSNGQSIRLKKSNSKRLCLMAYKLIHCQLLLMKRTFRIH